MFALLPIYQICLVAAVFLLVILGLSLRFIWLHWRER